MGGNATINKGDNMFSVKEKQHIAAVLEKTLLELNHPEMPTEKPMFELHVDGKESWSFADIKPNWTYDGKPGNPWNEVARDVLK
jgi:hypothetical protein